MTISDVGRLNARHYIDRLERAGAASTARALDCQLARAEAGQDEAYLIDLRAHIDRQAWRVLDIYVRGVRHPA